MDRLVGVGTAERSDEERGFHYRRLSERLACRSRFLAERRTPTGWLTVRGAEENNLKKIDVSFPLGVLTCVTGVSGSGKSSLVNEILYKSPGKEAEPCKDDSGRSIKSIVGSGDSWIKIIAIDQSPIGRTPRIQSGYVYRCF